MKFFRLMSGSFLIMIFIMGLMRGEDNISTDELRAGKNFIVTNVYSEKEDLEILKLFESNAYIW